MNISTNNGSSGSRWPVKAIREFARTASGGTPKRGVPAFYNGDIPWVKSGELGDKTVFEVAERITKLGLESSSAKLFPAGTLCIALYGATVGKLGILGIEAATNQAVCGILLPPEVDTRFMFRFLESRRRKLIEQGKGGAQPNISQEIIRNIRVPLPPLEEQQRIVAEIEKQFTRLDAGVASLRRVRTALKRYRASVLKAACEGRLLPTDNKRRRNVTFGELCHVQGGYAFKSNDYQPQGIPLIRISNLVDGEVVIDKKTPRLPPNYITDHSEFLLRTGDVLIAMSGATTGKMATFGLNEPALLNQRVGRFVVNEDTDTRREYLALVVEQIARRVLRDAYGAAQPNISPKKIEEMNLSLPALSEQIAIVEEVQRRLSVLENLRTSIMGAFRRASGLRRSVLRCAFSPESTN